MKLLSVFRTDKGIIVERRNQFGTSHVSVFDTPEKMLEYVRGFKKWGKIEEYELNISNEFWKMIIDIVNSPL